MITVEDLLMAYASAYDAWLDPEAERKNPTPEYAELIRQAISFENVKLRELCRDLWQVLEDCDMTPYVVERQGKNPAVTWLDEDWSWRDEIVGCMCELGIEAGR